MTPKEQYLCVIANDMLRKSDAIVLLEGDGLARVKETARLYKEGWAPLVVISGGVNNPPHSIPVRDMLPHLVAEGVPESAILLEDRSAHTRAQGDEIAKMAKEHGWEGVIIVASHYHQYRAFLTFLKAFMDAGIERQTQLINAPARDLSWFSDVDSLGTRLNFLEGEFTRIANYAAKGDLASYEDALAYQEWKESQQ